MYDEAHSVTSDEGLRTAAAAAAASSFRAIDCVSVWRDLTEGRTAIVGGFSAHGWSYLIIVARADQPAPRLAPRNREILEEVLLGVDPKVVSFNRKLSVSTIASCLKQAYEAIGIRCKPSKVPLLLVTLVHAAKADGRFNAGRAADFEYSRVSYGVLGMPSPDPVLERFLPPAEQAVVRMRLEGKTHAEIAARRQTSRRTVANQVAAAFHRLGVSCRSDLMEFLIESSRNFVGNGTRHGAGSQTPTAQEPA